MIGQPELLTNFNLSVNQDLKSRVTYSVITKRLHPDSMREFIHRELDRMGLPHSTFTEGAAGLIVRSASSGRTMDIDLVNRVLIQPHWQKEIDISDF